MNSPFPHYRQGGFTLIELMTVVVIIGTLAAIAVPNFVRFSDHAKVAAVKTNCHTIQLASEDFSVRNDGLYPSDTTTAGADGTGLVDLLPNGTWLENPFTLAATEPIDGAPAQPGQVGYAPLMNGPIAEGYQIVGFGRTAVAITLSSN